MTTALPLAGRRVLVTGASGFIGGHLTAALARAGAAVHGVSRQERAASPGTTWWRADLAADGAAARLLAAIEPDLIYHLASHVTGSRALPAVLPAFHANLASTVALLAAAGESGAPRIVLAGSLEEPDEDEPAPVPSSPYAAAKLAASAYARMFHALYRTPVVLARLFMVYGPGQEDRSKLVPYVTLSLLRGESPRLSSGTREVDWIHVADVVAALVALGTAPGVEGRTVDVGSGELHSIRAVVEMLSAAVDPAVPLAFGALPDRPLEQVRRADVAATAALLGWRASTPLPEGLAATAAWYRDHRG